jgi:hypothetical protein
MEFTSVTLIFLLLIIGGFLIESFVSQIHYFIFKKGFKKYHYKFSRYLFYLLFPILALIFSFAFTASRVFYVFIVFSVIGTVLEWLAGFAYHMVVGQRLWTYHRFSIGGYTSLFSIPLWGLGGVLFYLLEKLI